MELSLGSYLQQLRQQRGVALATLARAAQVSRSTLNNWETHRTQPRIQELESLLHSLRASESETLQALSLLQAPRAQKRLQNLHTAKAGLPLPHSGDLLRMLRIRRGWTQGKAASDLGVNQSTIARWERGESRPEAELLDRICRKLGAHKAERRALAEGSLNLSDSGREPAQTADREQLEAERAAIFQLLIDPVQYAMGDLYYLRLLAQTAPLARSYGEGRILMARILLDYAAYLADRWQLAEAGRLSERALEILPKSGERWNDEYMTAQLYWAVWKYPIREHVRLLKHWLERPLTLKKRSWAMSQIANSLLAGGQEAAALTINEQILNLVTAAGTEDYIQHQRNQYAENLMRAGRMAKALELFACYETIRPPNRIRTNIHLVETHLALGHRSRAHDLLQQVRSDTALDVIPYYSPKIEALTLLF